MTLNLPPKMRGLIYIIATLGTPTVIYLFSKGLIGQLEVTYWGTLMTAVTAMAGFNLQDTNQTK